jgi:hypothetical protein
MQKKYFCEKNMLTTAPGGSPLHGQGKWKGLENIMVT